MAKEITTSVVSGIRNSYCSYYKRSFQPRKYIKILGTEF